MANAKQQPSNIFKPKRNALNIFILGALYSLGSCANAQTISTNTDISGKSVSDGLSVSAGGITLNVDQASKITGDGSPNSSGAAVWLPSASSGSTVNISGSGTVVMAANSGLQLEYSTQSVINITDGARVEGVATNGLYIHHADGSVVNIDKSAVSGGESGVYVMSDGIALNISDSTISGSSGGSGLGYGIRFNGSNGTATVKNSTVSSALYGIFLGSASNSGVDVSQSTISGGTSGFRMYNTVNGIATFDNTVINGGKSIWLQGSNKNATVTVSNGSQINGVANGILGEDTDATGNNTINVKGSSVQASNGNGVSLKTGYTLNVSEGSSIAGDNAIVLTGDTAGSTVNVKDSTVTGKTNLLQISGTSAVDTVGFTGSTLSGAITTSSGADQSVNIDSSAWTGSAGKTGTGALALNISNGSAWVNNAATDVDAISLTGASTIVMDGGNIHTASLSDTAPTTLLAAASPTASTIYSTYNAETGSAFVLTADKASGSFNAGVTSSSSGAAGDMTGNTIVQVTDGSGATFNSMQSDVGVYRYESRSVANADGSTSVILDNITPEPTPDPAPGPNPNPNPDSRTLSTAAQAVVNTRAAAMSIWSDEQDVLNRRLDNERLTGSSDGTVNAWGSYYGGYHRQQVEQTSSAYDQTNNGFMLGADKRVDIAPGNLLFGFAATRGYSDVNMHDGGSAGTDVDSYGASLYTSLRLNNGLFFDASIKGTHLKNDISVTSLDGGHTTGDYNNNGFGGAFKTGYHKQFNAWYIEPYAQISYARYNSVDYKLKNGLHTKDDGSTSLGLEGGVNVGTAMALNNGTEVRPYVHLAVAGETENSNTMDINGEKINDSTDGSRGIVGLGADVKLSKNLSGWAGANYAKGQDHYESPWQLNAGVSYTW